MAFPVNPFANPMGMGAPFGPSPALSPDMFGGIPNAFPPAMPLAMGVPGQLSDPFGAGMGLDPFGMSQAFDPMTGMPVGPGFGGNPFCAPPMVDPMTGLPLDPMTGMPINPPFNPMMAGGPMPMPFPPEMGPMPMDPSMMGGAPAPQENPLSKMLKAMLEMQLLQKFMNPNGSASTTASTTAVGDNATAMDIIGDATNFQEISGGDGSISFLDLSRAARNSSNPEVQSAASYIMQSNPQLFNQLEGITSAGDGVFTENDLSKAMQDQSIVQGTPGDATQSTGQITDNVSALDQFAAKFDDLDTDHDGKITFVDLSRASSNSSDPTVKELADYLRTSGLFNTLDAMDSEDGVSLQNINDAYKDNGIVQGTGDQPTSIDTSGMTEQQALVIVNDNVGKFDSADDPKNKDRNGKSDSKISAEDLDAIINSTDPSVTDDMKKAAQVLKDNGTIGKMDATEPDNPDTHDVNESTDGMVSFDTLKNWATNYDTATLQSSEPKDLQSAMQVINDNITVFTNGDANKKSITYTELLQGLTSTDPKYTPEIKAALQYLQDHKDEFDTLDKFDSSDDSTDGSVMLDVIAQAATSGTQLDFGFNTASADANRRVLQWVKDKFDTLKNAGTSGHERVERSNLQSVLADTTGTYTAQDKAMAKYALNIKQNNGKTLWDSLGGKDGQVGSGDINGALNATDLSPTYVGANFLGSSK